MNWSDAHNRSEHLAVEAHRALRDGRNDEARQRFSEAAIEEKAALEAIGADRPRTLGIISVSATALFYKAGDLQQAEQLAHQMAAHPALPNFARMELRNLLQAIWNERAQADAGIVFVPGQVVVSVKGGQVVTGGAPLDLIVSKVQDIQSIFYRTAELLKGLPHRIKGPPAKDIQDKYKPWLFQSVPGSYQFIVAVQKPMQHELFPSVDPEPELLTETFLSIVKAGATDPASLDDVVPDTAYRNTFLRLTQNLAPTGKTFESIEIRGTTESSGILLSENSRRQIREYLRPHSEPVSPSGVERVIIGVLRALHLEKDWLEVVTESGSLIKISRVGEVVDDVIGPMVNHRVKVTTLVKNQSGSPKYEFVEIESDE